MMNVWTATQTKSLAARFDSRAARLDADVGAFDPLLDAIAFSRGRIAFGVTGQPPLVVPPWADVSRVIEDCRVWAWGPKREVKDNCRMFTSLQVLRSSKQRLIFHLALTQRKEVIRCLMVQQGGRREVFAGPRR